MLPINLEIAERILNILPNIVFRCQLIKEFTEIHRAPEIYMLPVESGEAIVTEWSARQHSF